MSIQLRFFVLSFFFLFSLTNNGYAANSKKSKRVKRRPPVSDLEMKNIGASGYPLSPAFEQIARASARGESRTASPAPSVSLQAHAPVEASSIRIVNFRFHPINLVNVLAQQNTLAEFRADVDFLLGERFTLGPSVLYQNTSSPDTSAPSQNINLERLEIGLLSNVYVTGTSSTGGLLFRPHLYYVDMNGGKETASGSIAASSSSAGCRTGMEVVYQKILPFGLNFEIGGGFTYYVVPFEVNYAPGAGLTQSAPDNRFAPIVTAGVGWAF